MERWVGKVALVTGASSGIGADIAKRLVSHGMKVVGCGRNVEAIQKAAKEMKAEPGRLTAIRCDLTKEDDILKMFETIRSDPDLGGVDVCVNNAGLALSAPLFSGKTSEWKEMLDVNVLALAICTREAFKSMQERQVKDGHIFLTNSMSGHRVTQTKEVHFYAATKFAVTALLEGIRQELRELKSLVRVTSISPALVVTNFATSLYKSEEKAKELYSKHKCLDTSDVTDCLIFALSSPQSVEINDILLRATEQVV